MQRTYLQLRRVGQLKFYSTGEECEKVRKVTMIPGAGVGRELMKHVCTIFQKAQVPVEFEVVDIDYTKKDEDANKHFDNAVASIKKNRFALKGNLEFKSPTDEFGYEWRSHNIYFRKRLDLYVYVCKFLPFHGITAKHPKLNIIMVNQNTEGEYSMQEHQAVRGVVEGLKIMSEHNVERVASHAYCLATRLKRKKVTIVHKANIMKLSDGLFLRVCKEVGQRFPEIETKDMIVDNCAMQMISKPEQFDVILTANLYGMILSNIAAGLSGGPGLHSGAHLSDNHSVFETATRTSAKDLVGKNIANPIAMVNAATRMLYHMGLEKYAFLIGCAMIKTACEDCVWTPDLGGTAKTTDVVDNMLKIIECEAK